MATIQKKVNMNKNILKNNNDSDKNKLYKVINIQLNPDKLFNNIYWILNEILSIFSFFLKKLWLIYLLKCFYTLELIYYKNKLLNE